MIIIAANVRGWENDNPLDFRRHNSLSNICLFMGGCMTLFIVSELIFIFFNWWKRNGSKTHFLLAFHGGWLGLHLLELTASRSTERQINGSSLYFFAHTWWLSFFLCHDDEVIASSLKRQTVGDPPLLIFHPLFMLMIYKQADCRHLVIRDYPSYTVVFFTPCQLLFLGASAAVFSIPGAAAARRWHVFLLCA
jgi:hypothetical protein